MKYKRKIGLPRFFQQVTYVCKDIRVWDAKKLVRIIRLDYSDGRLKLTRTQWILLMDFKVKVLKSVQCNIIHKKKILHVI